jgi:hypothetical protein
MGFELVLAAIGELAEPAFLPLPEVMLPEDTFWWCCGLIDMFRHMATSLSVTFPHLGISVSGHGPGGYAYLYDNTIDP